MNTNGKPRDPDFVLAESAMKRAAERARKKAAVIGRGVFVFRDGKVVEVREKTGVDPK